MKASLTTNLRDNTMDIARGIAIILVVIGHSGISSFFWNIIYFFHMPLFFFISGCFTKPLTPPKKILTKLKWKELYGNFVIYSTLFLVISPILYQWGFSNTPIESLKDFLERLIIILRFRTSTIDLLGQFWFLPVLFFAQALSLCAITLLKTKNKIFILIVSILFYIIGRFCFVNGYKEPYDFSRILYFTGFCILGYYSYPLLHKFKNNIYALLIAIIGLIYFSLIPTLVFEKIALYYFAAILGIFITIFISTQVKGEIAVVLGYIGKCTLPIFIFHPLIIKITELILSLINLITFSKGWTGSNPINPYWWLYSFMGIAIPLGYLTLQRYLKNKILLTK